MKKQELKVIYEILSSAKITKMEDSDKFKVIKIMRELKPIYKEVEEAITVAEEKLKVEGQDEMAEKARLNLLEPEEILSVNETFIKFRKDVQTSVKEIAEAEVTLKEYINNAAFEKLLASNDFNLATIMFLEEAIVK